MDHTPTTAPEPMRPYDPEGQLEGSRGLLNSPAFVIVGLLVLVVLVAYGVLAPKTSPGRMSPDAAPFAEAALPVPTSPPSIDIKVGNPAPNFALTDASTGKIVSLSSLRGKAVWVSFWATWCPPCREEMPEMQQIYEKYRERGLIMVGIDVEESAEQVTEFTSGLNLNWTFLLDSDGKVTDLYRVGGIPSHYFVDKDGVLRAVHIGGLENMIGRKAPVDEYLEKVLPLP